MNTFLVYCVIVFFLGTVTQATYLFGIPMKDPEDVPFLSRLVDFFIMWGGFTWAMVLYFR